MNWKNSFTRTVMLALGLAAAGSPAAADPGRETILFLEQRVKVDPLDFVAENRLSAAKIVAMRETGDLGYLAGAWQSAKASLAAVPAARNPGGLAALAVAEFESHHFQNALDLAQQAFAIDPRNLGARATAGDAELELGNYVEAEKIYDDLNAGESSAPLRARLARLAELKGDNQKAIALLRQNSGRPGDNAWYHVRLGELYFRSGDFTLAEAEYEAGRKLRPESYLVLEHLAELRGAQGKFDEAIGLYRVVIDRTHRAEFLQALGDLYTFMGKPVEAKLSYDQALSAYLQSVGRGNAHYYHHLAGFYSDAVENPVEALRWANKDLETRHSVYAYDTFAWALYKNGEFTRAAAEMNHALRLGTRDAHLLFHAAMIYSRAGELERGNDFLKQALAVNPRYNSFHVHR